MTRVVVPLASGFEEIEAVSVVDVLRRAEVEVVIAGVKGKGSVEGSHGIVVYAEVGLDELAPEDFDLLLLPGGEPGTTHLAQNATLLSWLRHFDSAGKPLAAICAAPRVLAQQGLLRDVEATSHPSVEDALRSAGAVYKEERVVRSGHIVTSRGPGTALEFALEVLGVLGRESDAAHLRSSMLMAR